MKFVTAEPGTDFHGGNAGRPWARRAAWRAAGPRGCASKSFGVAGAGAARTCGGKGRAARVDCQYLIVHTARGLGATRGARVDGRREAIYVRRRAHQAAHKHVMYRLVISCVSMCCVSSSNMHVLPDATGWSFGRKHMLLTVVRMAQPG